MSDPHYSPLGAEIVGAATPPFGRGPFNRGKPIVKVAPDCYVRVRDWHGHAFTGQPMTEREYTMMVGAQHFLSLERPIVAHEGVEIWVFRPSHPRQIAAIGEAYEEGVTLSAMPGPDGSHVVIAHAGDDLLDAWRLSAMEDAKTRARYKSWLAAETDALLALATSRTLRSDVLGLLIVIYEQQGRKQRAEGMATMALRSRGAAFEADVLHERDQYRRAFA